MERLCEEVMVALPDKHCSGRRKATDEEEDQRIYEKRSGERCVDGRFEVQLERDGGGSCQLDGDKCSVADVTLAATRLKSVTDLPRVGFGAHVCYHCRISPPCFLAEYHKRRLNQGSFVFAVF